MFDSGKSERICLEYLPPARTNIYHVPTFPFLLADNDWSENVKKKKNNKKNTLWSFCRGDSEGQDIFRPLWAENKLLNRKQVRVWSKTEHGRVLNFKVQNESVVKVNRGKIFGRSHPELEEQPRANTYQHILIHTNTVFGEGNGNPLQYSCLENYVDGGAWQATVHGVTKTWTRLSKYHSALYYCHYGNSVEDSGQSHSPIRQCGKRQLFGHSNPGAAWTPG